MLKFRLWLEAFDYENHKKIPNLVQTQLDKNSKYKVVVINVDKFDSSWSQDSGMYLPPGGSGENYIPIHDKRKPEGYNRYHRVGEEAPIFKQAGKGFDMPTVGLKYGIPIFIDGRHRFAYFRDLGAKTLPVSVSIDHYTQMKSKFGV